MPWILISCSEKSHILAYFPPAGILLYPQRLPWFLSIPRELSSHPLFLCCCLSIFFSSRFRREVSPRRPPSAWALQLWVLAVGSWTFHSFTPLSREQESGGQSPASGSSTCLALHLYIAFAFLTIWIHGCHLLSANGMGAGGSRVCICCREVHNTDCVWEMNSGVTGNVYKRASKVECATMSRWTLTAESCFICGNVYFSFSLPFCFYFLAALLLQSSFSRRWRLVLRYIVYIHFYIQFLGHNPKLT